MKCKSGRHEWMNPDSAAKCCNGWHRELRVAQPTIGQRLPAEASSVRPESGSLVGYVWVKDGEQEAA